MKNIFVFICFLVAAFSCSISFAQTNATSISNPELDSFIIKKGEAAYSQSKVPGILIAVLKDNKRNYYNFGFADAAKKIPFDSSTVFEIGSITKTFTAYVLTAVLKENHIADTSSILKYLPDSVQVNNSLASISFLSLMNHTSGLPRLPDDLFLTATNYLQPYENYTREKLYHYLLKANIHSTGKSDYSNLGAGLAGVLAATISHKTYAELLEQYIFKPFSIKKPISTSIKSVGLFNDKPAEYWNMNALQAAGCLQLNASAMLSYLQGMMHPITKNSKEIISQLTTATIAVNPQIKIARGWHTLELENKPVIIWHNGGTYGFSTFCAFNKEKNTAVLVVVNSFNKNAISDSELGFKIIIKLIE